MSLDWLPLEAKATVQVVSSCADIASFIAGFDYSELGRFGTKGFSSGIAIWQVAFSSGSSNIAPYSTDPRACQSCTVVLID